MTANGSPRLGQSNSNFAANQAARKLTNAIRKALDLNSDPHVSEIEHENLMVYFYKIAEFMSNRLIPGHGHFDENFEPTRVN